MLSLKTISNLFLTFTVFWVCGKFFSEYITIVDSKTIFLATILMWVMDMAILLLFRLSVATIPILIGCLTTIIMLIVATLSIPIELYILHRYLDGFQINGVLPFIILAVTLLLFRVSSIKFE